MKTLKINTEFAEKFNQMRIDKAGQKLTKEQLIKCFKEYLNCCLTPGWMKILQKYNIINPYHLGKRTAYVFCYSPVHKEKLKHIYIEVLEYGRNKKCKIEFVEEIKIVDQIQAAIELLKSNGYKIYKPTTTFEEI